MSEDQTTEVDPLNQRWCCLTCGATFNFGKLRMYGGGQYLGCPTCKSADVWRADGEAREAEVGTGFSVEDGTLQ